MTKIRVGILFGGRSGEHEVSLLSAASVLQAIDKEQYEVVPIGITKEGRWVTAARAEQLLRSNNLGKGHEERHLRAGDPEYTPGAAVLAKGESVVVPPVPVHSTTGVPVAEGNSVHRSPQGVPSAAHALSLRTAFIVVRIHSYFTRVACSIQTS